MGDYLLRGSCNLKPTVTKELVLALLSGYMDGAGEWCREAQDERFRSTRSARVSCASDREGQKSL